MIGTIIGNYKIEREIGEGGMSHVYIGRTQAPTDLLPLEFPVVLKVMTDELAGDVTARKRFVKEAQIGVVDVATPNGPGHGAVDGHEGIERPLLLELPLRVANERAVPNDPQSPAVNHAIPDENARAYAGQRLPRAVVLRGQRERVYPALSRNQPPRVDARNQVPDSR